MNNHRTRTRLRGGAALAIVAAASLALAACTSSSGGGGAKVTTEPSAGIPSNFSGSLPKPVVGKRYDDPQSRADVKSGGTLTLPILELGPNWNQFNLDGNTLYMGTIQQYVGPELWDYTVGGTATPNPDYLTSVTVTSKDPLVVTYDINPKAQWNNGDAIDWTAFKTTWETQSGKKKAFNPASTAGYDQVKSVTKGTSAKQAVVTFSTPFYPYQLLFGQLENPKNSDPTFYKTGWVNKPHPELGAGPFTVQSSSDSKVTLVRNPKWWGKPAKLSKVVFRQMEDSASINAFQNGEVDSTGVGTADRLKVARSMKKVQIRTNYALSTDVLILNGKDPALKDLKFREAIFQAVDRKQLAAINFQGLDWSEKVPGSEVTLPFQKGYKDNLPSDLAFSLAGAKKTMKADGYTLQNGYFEKDGKVATVAYTTFSDDPTTKALSLATQKMMKNAGIKLTIDAKKGSDFSPTITKGDYQLLPLGWSATDPYGYSSSGCQLYCSTSSSNFAFVGNKTIDAMMTAPGKTQSTSAGIRLFNTAETKAFELAGTIPTDNGPVMTAVKKGLANYGPSGFASLNLHPENIGWEK